MEAPTFSSLLKNQAPDMELFAKFLPEPNSINFNRASKEFAICYHNRMQCEITESPLNGYFSVEQHKIAEGATIKTTMKILHVQFVEVSYPNDQTTYSGLLRKTKEGDYVIMRNKIGDQCDIQNEKPSFHLRIILKINKLIKGKITKNKIEFKKNALKVKVIYTKFLENTQDIVKEKKSAKNLGGKEKKENNQKIRSYSGSLASISKSVNQNNERDSVFKASCFYFIKLPEIEIPTNFNEIQPGKWEERKKK